MTSSPSRRRRGVLFDLVFAWVPSLVLLAGVVSHESAPVPATPREFEFIEVSSLRSRAEELPLRLTVIIERGGFRVITHDGSEVGVPRERRVPADDYAALEREAKQIKQLHHHEVVVTIRADGAAPLAMLLRTIRAMRGSRCPFPAQGESEACLFFQTVVEAG